MLYGRSSTGCGLAGKHAKMVCLSHCRLHAAESCLFSNSEVCCALEQDDEHTLLCNKAKDV